MIDTHFVCQNKVLFINDEEVANRDRMISSIPLYKLHLNLQKGNSYSGNVQINFNLNVDQIKQEEDILQIDFKGKQVESVSVRKCVENQESNQSIKYTFEKHRIVISFKDLMPLIVDNKVCILIEFQNHYNTTDEDKGLFSTITGSNQYLYTQGEVAGIHYMFPCVEQINFRSAFSLTSVYPQDWICVSNGAAIKEESLENNMKKTVFEETQPFPCYLFALFAGNYVRFSDKYKDKIELGIYCRKEKEQFIQSQLKELFDITKFGLQFMEQYTQIDYYMKKLDQVFCIHYNCYGMENPGCVALEERRYLLEEEREPIKHMRRAYIIFHEISHFWFGDYVSLDWWNNLFLKEGQATFFGYKAVKEYYKNLGYYDHVEITKILILLNENEKDMFSLSHNKMPYFDYFSFKCHNWISYNKGGAVFDFLEQKVYGEDKFRDQLRQYLAAHPFSKAGIEDFLKFFPDNHLSYFEDNQFKDLKNLGLTENEYNQVDLQYIIINRQTKQVETQKRVNSSTYSQYPSNDYIIILNVSDFHLIDTRIKEDDLKFIDENKIIQKLNLSQRITIWKVLLFECVQFEKKSYFNDIFVNNIIYEENPVILHYILRIYSQYCLPFTVQQEDKMINLFNTTEDKLSKRIFLKNLVKFVNSEKNTFSLLEIYNSQERKTKEKYLKVLRKKIQTIYDNSISKLDSLMIKQ